MWCCLSPCARHLGHTRGQPGGGAVMWSRNMDTAKAEDVTIDLVRVDLMVASHHVHISLTSFQALLIHIHGSIS